MSARCTRTAVAGHEAFVLENPHLRAVVIPALGGRVWSLEDLARGRQWIWHRPGVPLAAQPVGASYDDVWAGGWEELFPNDAAGPFEGRDLPDHGEWWATPFTVAEVVDGNPLQLRMVAETRVVRAACEKTVVLAADAPRLTVRYAIRSLEDAPFHFLFKQHLPVALAPGCRLRLPGGEAEAVEASFGSAIRSTAPFAWPLAPVDGGTLDLTAIPDADSRTREFLYVRDLPAPWCGVDDPEAGASLRLRVDAAALPFTWLFLSYGGWRDVHTAVLEPCTTMPKALEAAVAAGQAARLAPRATFSTAVSVELGGLPAADA
jgi:hypothetical protein